MFMYTWNNVGWSQSKSHIPVGSCVLVHMFQLFELWFFVCQPDFTECEQTQWPLLANAIKQ